MGLLIVPIVVVFLTALSQANACRCTVPNLTTAFCAADFVIKIRAGASTIETVGGSPMKKIAISGSMAVYKFVDVNMVNNYPPTALYSDTSSCQAYLQENTWYVVAGFVSDGLLRVHACNYMKTWQNLTRDEKSKLRSGYYNLNCII